MPPGWPDYFNAVPLIDEWQAAGWDSDTWILNLGANDSGYCSADVACARPAIMLVVDAIGPGTGSGGRNHSAVHAPLSGRRMERRP